MALVTCDCSVCSVASALTAVLSINRLLAVAETSLKGEDFVIFISRFLSLSPHW